MNSPQFTVVKSPFRTYGFSIHNHGETRGELRRDGISGWYRRKRDAQERCDELNGPKVPICGPATPDNKFDLVGFIIAWENGELDDEAVVEGFQHLINSGVVWQLQGCYERQAQALIEAGLCTPAR